MKIKCINNLVILFCVVVSTALFAEPAATIPASHLYITWEGSGPDKGASAWLIKKFIDPKAVFVVRKTGEPVNGGIAFDVPESPFRRTHYHGTYEALLRAYKIENSTLEKMRKIIHDLEVNAWRSPVASETPAVQEMVTDIQRIYGVKPVRIECYIQFFDWLYLVLQKNKKDHLPSLPETVIAMCKSDK